MAIDCYIHIHLKRKKVFLFDERERENADLAAFTRIILFFVCRIVVVTVAAVIVHFFLSLGVRLLKQ
jgi:hypothetical protein